MRPRLRLLPLFDLLIIGYSKGGALLIIEVFKFHMRHLNGNFGSVD